VTSRRSPSAIGSDAPWFMYGSPRRGQVERNTESARQYALAERAVELGWPAESVLVVDEDTGQSARWAHARIGFRELAAEVGLGHVGVILALEVSRLARSSADWHQLLDLCALTGTLIADADGIYLPGDFNDRLLLGLKGTMSEAELHLIRSRLRGGLGHKAARGELRLPLPIGLERVGDGEIRLCVDEQVRTAIRRVFDLWDRCGSARQVVAALAEEGQRLPRRRISERRIRWEPPDYGSVHQILTNPNYAGAYAYGRCRQLRTVDAEGRVKIKRVGTPVSEWRVLITEHHPGGYEAERRRRQFDACEPENRLVGRSLERACEEALADVERQRSALTELDRHRPAPLSEPERIALRRLAGELPRVWNASSTTDRDRKELLRALLNDVVLTVDRDQDSATVELIWQGGARTELPVRMRHRTVKRSGTRPELIDLVRRLAEDSSDREIAAVLSKQGWMSPTGLPFNERRVRAVRERGNIPPARRHHCREAACRSTRPPANSG